MSRNKEIYRYNKSPISFPHQTHNTPIKSISSYLIQSSRASEINFILYFLKIQIIFNNKKKTRYWILESQWTIFEHVFLTQRMAFFQLFLILPSTAYSLYLVTLLFLFNSASLYHGCEIRPVFELKSLYVVICMLVFVMACKLVGFLISICTLFSSLSLSTFVCRERRELGTDSEFCQWK